MYPLQFESFLFVSFTKSSFTLRNVNSFLPQNYNNPRLNAELYINNIFLPHDFSQYWGLLFCINSIWIIVYIILVFFYFFLCLRVYYFILRRKYDVWFQFSRYMSVCVCICTKLCKKNGLSTMLLNNFSHDNYWSILCNIPTIC